MFGWLAAGSVIVQAQALRDCRQAMANFFAGTHNMPTWRKAGRNEGFRIVGVKIRRWSRGTGEVRVPKVGWSGFGGRAKFRRPSPTASLWTGQVGGMSHLASSPPPSRRLTRARRSVSTEAWPCLLPSPPESCCAARLAACRAGAPASIAASACPRQEPIEPAHRDPHGHCQIAGPRDR